MEERMAIHKIGAADRNFYYTSTGEKDSFSLYIRLSLDTKIETGLLYKALEKTAGLFRSFKMRPVIKDEILYYEDNDAPFPVFEEESHGPRYLGTSDTNGYLYRISCHENTMELCLFHGMADGLGFDYFIATLLDHYFVLADPDYAAKHTERIPDLFRLQDLEDPYAEFASKEKQEAQDIPAGKMAKVFTIPGEDSEGETPKCRYFGIDIKTEELLRAAKRCASSPLPFMTAVIGEAVCRVYGLNGEELVALTPANLRTVFGVNVCRNFARSFTIPYNEEINCLPFEERCAELRRVMKEATRPEIFSGILQKQVENAEIMENNSLPLLQRAGKMQRDYINGSKYFFSYVLTYIGRSILPEYIEKRVLDRKTMANNPPVCPWGVLGFPHHDEVHFVFSQFMKDTRLTEEVSRILNEKGVHAEVRDLGVLTTDRLVLDKIARV